MVLCVGLDSLPLYPHECLLPQGVVLHSAWLLMSLVKVTRDLLDARFNGHCSVLVYLQY